MPDRPQTAAAYALDGAVRDYAWGSRTAIQQLLGIQPDGKPAAELWFGAHPDDPARVSGTDATLDAIIRRDPVGALGAGVVGEFGAELPFLIKVLAAEKSLSLQVHPTATQAQAGFAAEQAQGRARDDPTRNYRDPHHKPELLCALTPFTALCGFRPPARTVELIDQLPAGVGAALAEVRADLAGADESAGLRAAFVRLLMMPERERAELTEQVVTGCRSMITAFAPLAAWADGAIGAARVVDLCARDFPGDVGAVLSLLLNAVVLQPGEAIYLGAGNVHAYLRGTGVEVMANSDNVLRCGLTAKHVDVAALLAITAFVPLIEPRWPAVARADARDEVTEFEEFRVPVDDFALRRIDLDAVGGEAVGRPGGPRIAVCVSGRSKLRADGAALDLAPGHGAFLSAGREGYRLSGSGLVFVAGVASGL